MRQVLYILIATFLLVACDPPKENDTFDRFVIATTYANNNRTIGDSLEMTNTICFDLIYVDKNSNCFIYNRTDKGDLFYKCKLTKRATSNFISFLTDLRQKFPNKYNLSNHCRLDVNIVLENDTLTDYRFIQTYSDNTLEYISDFIEDQAKQGVDTIETVIKYKYYILSQVSYLNRSRYDFEPINMRYLRDSTVKFVVPDKVDIKKK